MVENRLAGPAQPWNFLHPKSGWIDDDNSEHVHTAVGEPVWIIFLAWWILREKLTRKLLLLSLVAISGVVLISGLVTDQWAEGNPSGNLLILGGVLCCALYTVLARRMGVVPLFTVALQQTFAWGWALMISTIELNSDTVTNLLQFGALTWFWAGVSGVMYYALAFWFYLQGLARVSASIAGVFINLIPIFGIGGASLFLG